MINNQDAQIWINQYRKRIQYFVVLNNGAFHNAECFVLPENIGLIFPHPIPLNQILPKIFGLYLKENLPIYTISRSIKCQFTPNTI